jgi:hypothetical protein
MITTSLPQTAHDDTQPGNAITGQSEASVGRSPRKGWLRRTVVAVVATFSAFAGVSVITAGPANAVAYGQITACFQSATTLNGVTFWGPAQFTDAYVEVWDPNTSTWIVKATARTTANGCASMGVSTGWYWRMRVFYYQRPYRLVGTSAYALVGQALNYNVGTTRLGTVYVG